MEQFDSCQPDALELVDAWNNMSESERWMLYGGAVLMHNMKAKFIFAASTVAVIAFVIAAATIDGSPAWVGFAMLVGGVYGWVVSRISKYL